jgi:glycine cleavage system H lipoate-binding protein
MTSAIEILRAIGIFVSGMLVRDAVFVAAGAVLVVPAVVIALVIHRAARARDEAIGLRHVAGLSFRADAFYAPGHTWLHRREGGGTLELGVDDLALRLVPSVTAVDLPRPGTAFEKGETIAVLHAGGRRVPIQAPVAGTVSGANAAVESDPGLVKREGHDRGWLVAFRPADPSFADFPKGEAAEGWLQREAARWSRLLEDQLGLAAADGGHLVEPTPALLGEERWEKLTKEFLQA